MISEVTFKDGYKCSMKKIYNWQKCYIFETDTCYLIVPYGDVVHSKVTVEEFALAQKEAKAAPKIKKGLEWKEIKPTSSSDAE